MSKVILTTSHRPTPRTRSLLKDLVSVIPLGIRLTRGKATLDIVALQAIDIGADRIVILRNWKGNPRYIDVYIVEPIPRTAKRLCTLVLCGYKLARECGHETLKSKPKILVIPTDVATSTDTPENLVECIVQGFKAQIMDREEVCREHSEVMVMEIEPKSGRKGKFFEIHFRDCRGKSYGPVLRICKTKFHT